MEYFRKQSTGSGVLKSLDEIGKKEEVPKKKQKKQSKSASVRDLLSKLVEEKESGEKKKDTRRKKKPWRMPGKWVRQAKKSQKRRDAILVFFLNIKGELEPPMVVPIYGGNMVIIRNKVYEVDPRAIWSVKTGFNKTYKLLIIKEIDRRPVSNLDWDDIRVRGDATDSDEFLIKAALRAQMATAARKVGKGVIILIILAIAAGVIFFFMQ
jgi:hypothetical protein